MEKIMMSDQERIDYTKKCLELLEYKCVTSDDKDFRIYEGKNNNLPSMIDANFNDSFLNNWNWIMEVIKKILNTNEMEQYYTILDAIPDIEAVTRTIKEFFDWQDQQIK